MPSFCQLIWHYQYGLLFALLTHLPWCAIIAAHKVDSLKNIVYCFNITGHKNHIQRKWILNNRCHIQVQIPVKYLQATITFLAVTECGMKQTFIIKFWLFNDLDVVLVRFFLQYFTRRTHPSCKFQSSGEYNELNSIYTRSSLTSGLLVRNLTDIRISIKI